MATQVGSQKELMGLLRALINLNYNSIAAYQVAIPRLQIVFYRERFGAFLEDHERHVRDLSDLLRSFGGTPSRGGEVTHFFVAGKVVWRDLIGGDRAMLAAMNETEDDSETACARTLQRQDLPSEVRLAVERHRVDERGHRRWFEQRLALLDEIEDTVVELEETRTDFRDSDFRL